MNQGKHPLPEFQQPFAVKIGFQSLDQRAVEYPCADGLA